MRQNCVKNASKWVLFKFIGNRGTFQNASELRVLAPPTKYKTPLKPKIHPKIHPESSPETKIQKKYEKNTKTPDFLHFSYFFRIWFREGVRGVFWGVFWRSEGFLYSVGGARTRNVRNASEMRQICVKNASKMRGTPLGENTFWTIPSIA